MRVSLYCAVNGLTSTLAEDVDGEWCIGANRLYDRVAVVWMGYNLLSLQLALLHSAYCTLSTLTSLLHLSSLNPLLRGLLNTLIITFSAQDPPESAASGLHHGVRRTGKRIVTPFRSILWHGMNRSSLLLEVILICYIGRDFYGGTFELLGLQRTVLTSLEDDTRLRRSSLWHSEVRYRDIWCRNIQT